MGNRYSQLMLDKLFIVQGCYDSLVADLHDLYCKFDKFCMELLNEPLPMEVAFSHLLECNSEEEVTQVGFNILLGIKSGAVADLEDTKSVMQKFFNTVAGGANRNDFFNRVEQEDLPDAINKYLIVILSFLRGMDTNTFVGSLVERPNFDGYCKIWAMLRTPLTVGDAFNYFCEDKNALQYVEAKTRRLLARESSKFFEELTEDQIRGFHLKRIIKMLFSKAEPGVEFNTLVDFAKNEIERLEEQGVFLNDLRLIDYVLGQCREVINYEQDDKQEDEEDRTS